MIFFYMLQSENKKVKLYIIVLFEGFPCQQGEREEYSYRQTIAHGFANGFL